MSPMKDSVSRIPVDLLWLAMMPIKPLQHEPKVILCFIRRLSQLLTDIFDEQVDGPNRQMESGMKVKDIPTALSSAMTGVMVSMLHSCTKFVV